MTLLSRLRAGLAPFIVGLAVMSVVATLYVRGGDLTSYAHYTIELTGIYIIVTAGLNIAVGLTGQFQMAQPALMAISAYTTAVLTLDHGWSLLLSGAAALAITTAVAGVVGLLTARLRTHYLLLGTFALQVIVVDSIRQFSELTGGVNGHAAPVSIEAAGSQVSATTPDYTVLVIMVTALALLLAQWLIRSNLGLLMKATRHSNLLMLSTGTNPAGPRLMAVLVSGLYAAVGGFLIGPLLIFLSPDSFGTTLVLLFVLMVVIGGSGSVVGVAVGTAVLNWILQSASTSATAEYWPIVFGLALMATLVVAPGGLAGLSTGLVRRFRDADLGADGAPLLDMDAAEQALTNGAEREGGREGGLAVAGIGRRYGGVTALTQVSFEVEPGTVHGLIGPNGSGKTTLLDVISGFNTPDEGMVSFGSIDVTRTSPERRARLGIRRSFQHPLLVEDATALENVVLGDNATMSPLDKLRLALSSRPSERVERARAALTLVGLGGRAEVTAQNLSYGERKLLDIARALVSRPALLVLDEPAAGLPGPEVARVEAVIQKLNLLGYGVLIVEHNMTLIMGLCTKVTVLANGHHLLTATPTEVQQDPHVVEVYLGSNVRPEEATA